MNQGIGIYIHIPFCEQKCYYCDFVSYAQKEEYIATYIEAVCKEILENAEILCSYPIETIYIGGGTPSCIDSSYIVQLLQLLQLFQIQEQAEITIEVNPNSVTAETLKAYKEAGVNRISMGVQSTKNHILKTIGRIHTFQDVQQALEQMKQVGIENVSVDLMYPLPNLTIEAFKESVTEIIALSKNYPIRHVSIYNLEVHEGTKLHFLLQEGYVEMVSEEVEYQMKEWMEQTLEQHGFMRYEISNFSKKGYESKHNLGYWKQNSYLGFGIGASSFFSGTRYKNTDKLDSYIKHQNTKIEQEALDKLSLMKEFVILQLRLEEGILLSSFFQRFHVELLQVFQQEIEQLVKKELLYWKAEKTSLALTKRGREVANLVWESFI